MKFAHKEQEQIAEANNISIQAFKKNYVVVREKKSGICIFQASYLLFDAMDQQTHALSEDNAMIRVADGCLTSIPVIGMFSGYFFHPSYTITDVASGVGLMRLTKEPAFFEGKFKIEALADIADEALESRLILSLVMMILLERARG